jgi:hypothetical protein
MMQRVIIFLRETDSHARMHIFWECVFLIPFEIINIIYSNFMQIPDHK